MLLQRLQRHRPLWITGGFLALLLVAWLAFRPGLGGTLIFDDIPNLQPWEAIGDLDSWEKVSRLAASGSSTPGRPLSLASFALDDQGWPVDIPSLKRTNLALHLLNASLVFWLGLLVFQRVSPAAGATRQAAMALFAAAVWTLHPLQVSNVSYIIQRMNLLSTFFELAGMVLFMKGRARLENAPARALILCTAAVGLLMPAAVLAKENGLLLCAFVLLLERFCFAPSPRRWWPAWKLLVLWAPLLLFAAYCVVRYKGFTSGFHIRNFDAWERLLTQGPVLVDYLGKLLHPRLHGSGLYFDNFPVSHSLLDPPGTLLAWLLIAALLALAWWCRERRKAVAFGIFFYFTGHLMESTVLPLELYFEHRNYLPQAGLWIALASLAGEAQSPRLRRTLAAAGVLLLGLLFVMTRSNATLWGDSRTQAAVWYHENPGSLRTTLAYADLLLKSGRLDELDAVLDEGRRHYPRNLAIVVSQRFVHCYWRDLPTNFDDLPAFALHADYEVASVVMLQQMQELGDLQRGQPTPPGACTPASRHQISNVFVSLMKNPPFATGRMRASLMEFIADTAVEDGRLGDAMHAYDEAFRSNPQAIYPYRQALLLQSAGLTGDALEALDRSEAALTTKQRLQFPELEPRVQTLRATLQKAQKPTP